MKVNKSSKRSKIKLRIRNKIKGSASRPRLSVFRSNKEIYAQLIDDLNGVTILAASSRDEATANTGNKSEVAKAVGKLLASKASSENISAVVFDRNGYLYHGRVKALAEGAREGGLQF